MKTLDELREESLAINMRDSNLNLKIEKKIEKAIMAGLSKKQNWVEITKIYSIPISEEILKQQKYSFLSIGNSCYICLDGEDIYKYKKEIRSQYLKPADDTKTEFKHCMIEYLILFAICSLLFYFITKLLISDVICDNTMDFIRGTLNCYNTMGFIGIVSLIGVDITLLLEIGISIKFIIQILYNWFKKDSKYVKKIESEWISATYKNKEDIHERKSSDKIIKIKREFIK